MLYESLLYELKLLKGSSGSSASFFQKRNNNVMSHDEIYLSTVLHAYDNNTHGAKTASNLDTQVSLFCTMVSISQIHPEHITFEHFVCHK